VWRQRQRNGIAIAPAPYNDVVVSALVRWRFLDSDEVHTPQQIDEAMFAVVEQVAALGELNELLKYLRGEH